MGNLLFDCLLRDEGKRSALFRLRLSPAGVCTEAVFLETRPEVEIEVEPQPSEDAD